MVLKELVTWNTTGEVPDVIGWRATACVLIECKTSRADFRADLKKPFRVSPASGMGDWRFYLCPQGLIEADEVPERWGLLWAHEGRVKPIVGVPRGNMSWHSAEAPFRGHKESENAMLVSALRRLGQKGLLNFE